MQILKVMKMVNLKHLHIYTVLISPYVGITTEKWVGLKGRVRTEINNKNHVELQQKETTLTHTQTEGRIINT